MLFLFHRFHWLLAVVFIFRKFSLLNWVSYKICLFNNWRVPRICLIQDYIELHTVVFFHENILLYEKNAHHYIKSKFISSQFIIKIIKVKICVTNCSRFCRNRYDSNRTFSIFYICIEINRYVSRLSKNYKCLLFNITYYS